MTGPVAPAKSSERLHAFVLSDAANHLMSLVPTATRGGQVNPSARRCLCIGVGRHAGGQVMAGADDELKELRLRVRDLEAKLETVSRRSAVEDLSEADIEAFHKVQNAFWEDGSCGINETSPCILRCNIFNAGKVIKIPKPCDIECTCGPCNIFGPMVNVGALRFRGLGG